jgi:D-glycero-D-manno-heptose 1,7-bisphosphate phosphatase
MHAERRRAVFLDRDGTIVVERHYLSSPEDVELIPGAASAIRALRAAGYAVVVVTNQAGIARGLYQQSDYDAVAARMSDLLAQGGATLDATYHCPHHPDFTGPCDCRKPEVALYRAAEADLGLDLAGSWFVGDKTSDLDPARRLGGRAVLVRTGYGREHEKTVFSDVAVVEDLAAATAHILACG